jgi:hypothetical protein
MIALGTVLAVAGLSLQLQDGTGTGAVRPTGAPTPTVQEPIVPTFLPSLTRELPPQQVTLPSGELVDFHPHVIWKPICTGAEKVSPEQLERMVATHQLLDRRGVHVIDTTPGGREKIGAFNIVFVLSGSIPPAAPAAFAACESYIESFFSDPITITVNVSFQVLSPGVLGSTGSSSGWVSYSPARAQIVQDMDAGVVDDTIQAFLPSGSTCPVRYTSGSTVTNEDRVFFNFAAWKAVDGTVSGADASMTLNSSFAFDYDPSNGITSGQYSFQDIIIHETGHAMGFTSGVDFRFRDMDVLDLFRFQRTDGSTDNNPDTTAEFQVRPRRCSYNAPNDDHNSDLVSAEYRMSDGNPYQASHFREQTPNIGLMDPALAAGQTFWPAFYSTADLAMFDAIGYDY